MTNDLPRYECRIAVLNNPASPVRARLDGAIGRGGGLSDVVLFELQYGAAKSARPERHRRRIADFLTGPIERGSSRHGNASRVAEGNIGP